MGLPLVGCGDDGSTPADTDGATTTSTTAGEETGTTEQADSSSGDMVEEPPPEVDWVELDCDSLVPDFCMFPFPSNVQTTADADTSTGRRVDFSVESMPTSYYDVTADPRAWDRGDGFSTGVTMMAHLPGATSAGLPSVHDVEASLAEDSPTIVLDAETGERVAHFAELDAVTDDDERRTFLIRPAQRLESGRRYIVAIRGVVDAAGEPLAASEAFAALRDLQPSDDASVDERRALYADIFSRLRDAGVERSELQLAWDFTTESSNSSAGWIVHMRDVALEMTGDAANFEITSVEEDFDPRVAYRIRGQFEVPLFLDVPGPVSVMNLGDDGLPAVNGTAMFDFTLLIPASASMQPAALLQFGHGFLGGQGEIERDSLIDFADANGYALFACDWIGLSDPDEAFLGAILDSGRIEEFGGVFARTMQATINALVLNRVVANGIAADPIYADLLDADSRYYYGISLGGILGTLYMSLSTDVQRGVVDVMGAPFGMVISRSRQFDAFMAIASATYQDPRDVQLFLSLAQLLWDPGDPNSLLPNLREEPLSGSESHDLLMRAALGDHSVPNAAALYLARSLGAPHVDTGLRSVWGLDSATDATGLAYVEYDFGLPEDPACNLPQRACNDPHGGLRGLAPADAQLDRFLREGTVGNSCDGACSFPDVGACSGDPPADACVP
ncbi:MAG: Ig-like domain-containing protein [Myxococcota bacterium]